MANIVNIVTVIIVSLISIYALLRMYKNSNTLTDRILFFLSLIAVYTPIIIYLLDRFNVLTLLIHTNNIDTNEWFNYATSYSTAIVSAIISGVILVYVTHGQIENDNLRKDKELKEQRRVNNLPILKCDFIGRNEGKYNHLIFMTASENNSKDLTILDFIVENIGLNTARNIRCGIRNQDDDFEAISIPNDGYYTLKVGEVETFGLYIDLDFKKSKTKKIVVTFYYEDLFNNHYAQDIYLTVEFTSNVSDNGLKKLIQYEVVSCMETVVKRERLIEEK